MSIKIKENLVKGLWLLLFTIVGFFISEFTREFRENFSNASLYINFNSDKIGSGIDLEANRSDGKKYFFDDVKDYEELIIEPGRYNYKLLSGNYSFQEGTFELSSREYFHLSIDKIPIENFLLFISADKDEYLNKEQIHLTINSSKKCWAYLFTKKAERIYQLNDTGFQLDPNEDIFLDNLYATNFKGYDQIICIATLQKDSNILNQAVKWFEEGGKADQLPEETSWRVRSVKFTVR